MKKKPSKKAEGRGKHDHQGLPCTVGIPGTCSAIEEVLGRIVERSPLDMDRIRRRLLCFRVLPAQARIDGTVGEFVRIPPRLVEAPGMPGLMVEEAQVFEDGVLDVAGEVYLAPDSGLAVVAHELGHVATTQADLDRRRAPCDEWASELAADYYAYRWGFGREIAATRRARNLGHHLGAPGSTVGADGIGCWRISRHFVMHPCPPQTAREVHHHD